MSTPLRRIVAGIATLDSHDPALAPAVRLAEQTGADLHLVHVYAPDAHPSPSADPPAPAIVHGAALARSLTTRLEALARTLTQRDRITFLAAPGRAGDVLPRIAANVDADLLVLGRSRRSGAAAAVLGTTAQRVLRASTIPVLALHSDTAPATHDRVLLATDLSGHSAHAMGTGVQIARALAHPFTPTLRPLYVTVPSYQAAVAGLPERPTEEAARDVEEFLADVPGMPRSAAAVRVGEPADEILAEAAQWQADLVVMGTHGRRGLPRLLLGSVAETVIRRAHSSVLVIPPAGAATRHATSEAGAVVQLSVETTTAVAPRTAIDITTAFRPPPEATPLAAPIVVATDLSGACDHVVRSGAAAARAAGAPLHVVHALGIGSVYGRHADRAVLHDRIAAAQDELRAQVARTVPHDVVVAAQHVETGAAPRAVAEYVERVSPSLLVVGAHTHHGSYLGVLGSTTDRLIRTLRVPCLVVRTELGV
ncbi:MAG TPA: universal stress protein, partial [Longimicrobiaceae bacterium]|nr:universal stress protein [Longimicrobiaceae bacterium]